MTPPARPDPRVEELVCDCLEAWEAHGPGAVDELLAARPDVADAVRARLEVLGRLGMLEEAPGHAPPERIGSYVVHRELGRGGMGVVYEAEQRTPRRRVALKVLRARTGTSQRERLHREAGLLARLHHPGIARIYESGEARLGGVVVPFFAMELVEGEAIDRWAERRGLDVRGRLALLALVADAVQHAHQRGVVHRDLKPANVLVDERGQPHVLDFGIARATDPDLELERHRTRAGQLVGTLAYMSPEQAAGDPAEVDTRTDVYSLGVLAFRLLAGRLPHDVDDRPMLEALQTIRDVEAPRLGTLDRALRGDVETIVAKALAKEKDRRYPSAHELAADLRRHLADQPIAARPATATYQLAKFARRHRTLVLGAASVVVALAAGLAGTLHGLVRAEERRAEAEQRFEQARAVLAFQSRMFASADPDREGIGVVDLLDRAALMIEGDVEGPIEEAAVRMMVGEAYAGLGEEGKAEPLVARAVELYDAHVASGDLAALAARRRLAELLGGLGRFEEAERVLDGVVATARREHGPGHEAVHAARLARAQLLFDTGSSADAVASARAVREAVPRASPLWLAASRMLALALDAEGDGASVDVARAAYDELIQSRGAEHPRTIEAMETYGLVLQAAGRVEDGGALLEHVLELRRKLLGDDHPDTLRTVANAAVRMSVAGELEEAEELLRAASAACARRLAPGHPTALLVDNNLATMLLDLGQEAEAAVLLERVLELEERIRGPEHPHTLSAMGNLAAAYFATGRLAEAEDLHARALDARRATHGDRHPLTLDSLYNLGAFYSETGEWERGEELLAESVETGYEVLGDEHPQLAVFLWGLGKCYLDQGRFDDAELALLEGEAVLERSLEGEAFVQRTILATLELLYRRAGDPERAEAYAARLADG